MNKLIIAGIAILFLSGCTTVNWTADRVAYGVNKYCETFTPVEREAMRARVNEKTYPNSVMVECAGQN